ncbi:hypothetical protein ODJ79_02995 [Actinoplanes sp. KI2]|uniref:hypothetical protein n=1 Tax=Actinoplanes sp. KI2 TaxID=2983315 RepID=UPI0021D5A7EF|nr:hypothetical protein [Actinoplanes sp. KI2]MCU7722672.1 hypothetical protein [Actinoplanes sp. KI2]
MSTVRCEVILSVVLFELHDTTAVRWRRELIGSGASPGRHWATKVSYYRAVESLLDRGAGLSWQDVVAEVRPRGSRTTFFAVAAALDHAPPACAIEDLVVILDGRVSAAEADGLLREAIRLRQLGGYGVAGVLHRLRPHIRPQLPVAAGNCGLARAIGELTRDGRATDDVRRQAVEIMQDAIDQLELRGVPEWVADAA